MKSFRRVGLSRLEVTEVAEQTLRLANSTVVEVGPGLRWRSPERRSRSEARNVNGRGPGRRDCLLWVMPWTREAGRLFREEQMEEVGMMGG